MSWINAPWSAWMFRSARTAGVTVIAFIPPRMETFSASVVGRSLTGTRAVRGCPPCRYETTSVSPGPVSSSTASQSRNVRNLWLLAPSSTSPAAIPARAAGPPGAISVTRRPPARFQPRRSCASTSSPTHARRTVP